MSDSSPTPPPQSISTYVEEGARIAAILLVWAVISLFFAFGLTELNVFGRTVLVLSGVFALTGVLNAVLYICVRTIDYWHQA